jgi:hypothetical protein
MFHSPALWSNLVGIKEDLDAAYPVALQASKAHTSLENCEAFCFCAYAGPIGSRGCNNIVEDVAISTSSRKQNTLIDSQSLVTLVSSNTVSFQFTHPVLQGDVLKFSDIEKSYQDYNNSMSSIRQVRQYHLHIFMNQILEAGPKWQPNI